MKIFTFSVAIVRLLPVQISKTSINQAKGILIFGIAAFEEMLCDICGIPANRLDTLSANVGLLVAERLNTTRDVATISTIKMVQIQNGPRNE